MASQQCFEHDSSLHAPGLPIVGLSIMGLLLMGRTADPCCSLETQNMTFTV